MLVTSLHLVFAARYSIVFGRHGVTSQDKNISTDKIKLTTPLLHYLGTALLFIYYKDFDMIM